jgi:hypothetical protein
MWRCEEQARVKPDALTERVQRHAVKALWQHVPQPNKQRMRKDRVAKHDAIVVADALARNRCAHVSRGAHRAQVHQRLLEAQLLRAGHQGSAFAA